MANKKRVKPLIDDDGEVLDMTEWDEEDFKRAIPFSALPEDLQKGLLSLNRRANKREVHADTKKQGVR